MEGPGVGLSPRRACWAGALLVALVLVAGGCGGTDHQASAGGVAGHGSTHPARTTPTTAPPRGTTSTAPTALESGPATVYVLSDSVILGAQPQIQAALPGWQVRFDSKVSRSIYAGISILSHLTGPSPRVVVIHLCTNWSQTTFGHEIDAAMASLTGVDRVIWVTCTPWNPGVISADAAIGVASVQYRPRVVVADWAAISATPGYTYRDGLHLQVAGAEAMAKLIAPLVGPAPVSTSPTAPTSTASTTSTARTP